MINLNILMYTVHGQTLFIFAVKSVGNSIQYSTGKRTYLSIFWVNEVGVFSCLHCIWQVFRHAKYQTETSKNKRPVSIRKLPDIIFIVHFFERRVNIEIHVQC